MGCGMDAHNARRPWCQGGQIPAAVLTPMLVPLLIPQLWGQGSAKAD